MAYPFVSLPTLAEFVEAAKAEHGYVLTEQISFTLNGKKQRGPFLHDKKKPQIRVFCAITQIAKMNVLLPTGLGICADG